MSSALMLVVDHIAERMTSMQRPMSEPTTRTPLNLNITEAVFRAGENQRDHRQENGEAPGLARRDLLLSRLLAFLVERRQAVKNDLVQLDKALDGPGHELHANFHRLRRIFHLKLEPTTVDTLRRQFRLDHR